MKMDTVENMDTYNASLCPYTFSPALVIAFKSVIKQYCMAGVFSNYKSPADTHGAF